MKYFWRPTNLYSLRYIKRRWLYGLISVTIFGSGGSYLLLQSLTDDIRLKVRKKLEHVNKILITVTPTNPTCAVTDWEDWLTSDYLSGSAEFKPLLDRFITSDPWVLLELTKSSNFKIRQFSVTALAKSKWEAHKIRNIAQACDPRTSASLAHFPHASNEFFLPPPRLQNSQYSTIFELRKQLTLLPTPTLSTISHFKAIALANEVVFEDAQSLDLEGPLYAIPGEKEKKEEKTLLLCLQAILEYTEVKEFSVQFTENHGLAVLQRLLEDRNELWVKIYVASILANLSLHRSLLDTIVRTGWLYVLRQWISNENITLSMLAHTALANLDRDSIDKSLYHDIILIHPTQRTRSSKVDVVFVHGLKGGAVRTWRQKDDAEKPSQCWPLDWLSVDCPNIRIISLGYNSYVHQWGDFCPVEQYKHSLEVRGYDLIQKLKKAKVGSRPIIWVGHSMGGLLIKEILALSEENSQSNELQSQTAGIVMYSVPHQGSAVVDHVMLAKYLFRPSLEVQELRTSSPKLKELHDKFLKIVSSKSVPLLSFGETLKTDLGNEMVKIMIVPPESSDPGVGEFINLPVNHINSCKPASKSDVIYQNTLSFIKNIVDNNKCT